MRPPDDFQSEMADVRRLADTFDRLLADRLEPGDAPAGFAGVVELVRALTVPATTGELAGQTAAVAAATALLTAPPAPTLGAVRQQTSATPRWTRSRLFRTKVASLAFAGALLGTTGLAAAGVLPDPVQDVAHDVLAKVGIHVPSASGDPADEPGGAEPAGGGVQEGEESADPHDEGTTGNPDDEGTTGNPHDEGTTGNPHDEGTTGNPHDEGTTGNPHDGETGNPHDEGTTGNPHEGESGNPHDDGTAGNPHDEGTTGNPHN
jgi:hypothetical protein